MTAKVETPPRALFPTGLNLGEAREAFLASLVAPIRATFHLEGLAPRHGVPLFFWGPAGTGKSSCIRKWCDELHIPCEVLSPALRGEGAFGVVPVPRDDRLRFPAADWVDRFESGRGVLFLDELARATPGLQPPLLGLVLDGVIGSYQLPPGVRRVAASNKPGRYGGWEMDPAGANRGCHLGWPVRRAGEVGRALLRGYGQEEAGAETESLTGLEERVVTGWADEHRKVAAVLAGAMAACPDMLPPEEPPEGDETRHYAWSSARSWEMAASLRITAQILKLTNTVKDALVMGCVGEAASSLLATWEAKAELPDPLDVLEGRVTFRPDPRRSDRTHAVIVGCVATLMHGEARKAESTEEKRKREARWLDRLAAVVSPCSPAITVPGLFDLVTQKSWRERMLSTKAWQELIVRLTPALSEMGYTPR